jgi:predicted transcriptional regulator
MPHSDCITQIIVDKLAPIKITKLFYLTSPIYMVIGDIKASFAKQQTIKNNQKEISHAD